MPKAIQRPERLLAGFFVVLCLPFLAVAVAGVRSAGHEGPVATGLALLPLPLFGLGFRAVARRFRAAPDRLGVAGLAARLLLVTVAAGALPALTVLALHAAHTPATGTYVVVDTPEGRCLVERVEGALRTGDDHPEGLIPAMRALAAGAAPLPAIAPEAVVGARVRVFRKGLAVATGTVTAVYGTRAGRRLWVTIRHDEGGSREAALLSICTAPH